MVKTNQFVSSLDSILSSSRRDLVIRHPYCYFPSPMRSSAWSTLKTHTHFTVLCQMYMQAMRTNIFPCRVQLSGIPICASSCLLQAGFLLVLFYNPEDDGNMFLQNISWHSLNYAALYPRIQNSSKPLLWEYQILHNKHISLIEYLA
jgi:hypothetical protein